MLTVCEQLSDRARALAPEVLRVVMRRYRDFAGCEDAVQDALLAAAKQWPVEGVPDHPRAWLVHVATRRLTDQIRAEAARRLPKLPLIAGGKSFGNVGPYEQIIGVARFALDPEAVRNEDIVDLWLAPRNARGKVEFATDFCILAPKDPAKGNGAIFYDVNNRGRKLAVDFFNRSPYPDKAELDRPERNGFLMRHGYTVAWVGWQHDVPRRDGLMVLDAPRARDARVRREPDSARRVTVGGWDCGTNRGRHLLP